jgi:ribose-phosphate pyrophosphokinase
MTYDLNPNDVRFFSGQSHPELAREITDYLQVPLDSTSFSRFSNDNLHIQLGASVRGRAVFIIQSLVKPVSDNLVELFMMLDIAHGAGAREIHAIIPYYSYARSDKKDAPRISIAARLIADLLAASGATHVMTMTLHSPQVHGFFSIPADPLTARPLFVRHFAQQNLNALEAIVVAPDMGRANAASRFANALGLEVAAAEKKRMSDTHVKISSTILRQVEGYRKALIYDDEIATGSSVIELTNMLIGTGIKDIALICTHGVFTNRALPKLSSIPQISEIVTTNTVPIPQSIRPPHLTVLSVGSIFGEAIARNYSRQSIGDLFPFGDEPVSPV